MSRDIIKLDQIDVTFHQKKRTITAVKDVTIHIQEGDIYGIVGYSGAGKSTLVRVINLLQKPSAGKITIDDDVIFDGKVTLTAEQLRRKRQDIGMIFQHFNLMSQKTAEENVAFALKHSGLSKEEKKAKVAKLLDLVGLADRAENYPSQLSGGQKQRVAIARALANDPKILISDESTSALDPKTTKQILALLQDLNQKLGLTVVLITHEMQIVKDIANRVAVMQDGRLIEEGSVLEIFSDPKQPLTQDFISTATGIDEAMEVIEDKTMDEEFRRYQPAILTWYETAQHAFDRGASWQNMGGIENSLDGGLYHFKSKFNPVIEEFVGEFNLPTSPLYPLVNKVYKIRKKLRSK